MDLPGTQTDCLFPAVGEAAGPGRSQGLPAAGDSLSPDSALLASILIRPEIAPEVIRAVDTGMFQNPRYRVIFQAVTGLTANGRPVDLVGIKQWLLEKAELREGMLEALVGLADAAYTSVHWESCARAILHHHYTGLAARQMERGDWKGLVETSARLEALKEARSLQEMLDSRFPYTENRANQEKRFILTPLGQLLTEPPEERAWVVDRMLPAGGTSVVGAKPKVGKSTLARNLALAVARGVPFLDRPTTSGPVVYLALEEKRAEVQGHFSRMGAVTEPIFIHVGSAPDEALVALAAAIEAHKPVLAIVDPLFRFVRITDGNDYAEMNRKLEPLVQLARSTGCHLLLVHHLGKGERTGGDAILGSTAIFAAVDAALMMKMRERFRSIETSQRYGSDLPDTALAFDEETGRITVAGEVASIQLREIERNILEALGEGERTEAEIKEEVGGNQSHTGKALRQLLAAGAVEREGSGGRGGAYRYRKSGAPPANTSVSEFSRLPLRVNLETEHPAGLFTDNGDGA